MISGGQKKTKACLNLACVAWRFKRQFDRERTQHDCLKTARLCRLVWILNWCRKGEFQWQRFTFYKHLCRNICSLNTDKNTWCPVAFAGDSRLLRQDSRLARNNTRGSNLLLSGTVCLWGHSWARNLKAWQKIGVTCDFHQIWAVG